VKKVLFILGLYFLFLTPQANANQFDGFYEAKKGRDICFNAIGDIILIKKNAIRIGKNVKSLWPDAQPRGLNIIGELVDNDFLISQTLGNGERIEGEIKKNKVTLNFWAKRTNTCELTYVKNENLKPQSIDTSKNPETRALTRIYCKQTNTNQIITKILEWDGACSGLQVTKYDHCVYLKNEFPTLDCSYLKEQQIAEDNKITAELDINESNINSKKVKVETNIDKVSLKKELEYWKELFEDELITKAEYDAKRKELLNQPITKTEVKSNKSINNNTNQTEKEIKKVSIDKSYQNKNYLYEKIDRKLFPMPTDRIFKNCNKDYRKILEQIKCSKDNLRATHRYKKRLKYFDIYELHVTTLDTIEDLILKGQLTEMQAKSNVASLNTQTINILDNRAELNRQKYERIGKLGQQLADPNYDITTGTYKNQNNNNTFQNQNNQSCMYNPATDDYQICLHKGAEQNSCFHFGNQCTP